MEPKKFSPKDFFLNIGAIVALYVSVGSLLNLLFTIINTAYPQTSSYNYLVSGSISWPVAALIVVFPVFILLMWLMEKSYISDPERRESGIHKLLSYITLFLAGGIMIGDLVTVLYYFLDGQELTTGFLLKVLVLLVVSSMLFYYFISEIRGRLTGGSRKIWRVVSGVLVLGSIVLGFSVLGSPNTQRLIKYDEQKLSDLMSIKQEVTNFYATRGVLPENLDEMLTQNYYSPLLDPQTQKPYEYKKTGNVTYNLCANFNRSYTDSYPNGNTRPAGYVLRTHTVGRFCFQEQIDPQFYPVKKLPL